jgi:hypothetical protein
MERHAMTTGERIDELEERLNALTSLLSKHFSVDELHDLAELLADDLLRDDVDVRSTESLSDSGISDVS